MNGLRKNDIVWCALFQNRRIVDNIGFVTLSNISQAMGQSVEFAQGLAGIAQLFDGGSGEVNDLTLQTRNNEAYRKTFEGVHPKAIPYLRHYNNAYVNAVAIRVEWLEQFREVLGWKVDGARHLARAWWMSSPEVCQIAWAEWVGLFEMLFHLVDNNTGEEEVLVAIPGYTGNHRGFAMQTPIAGWLNASIIREAFKYVLQENLPVIKPFKNVAENVVGKWANLHPAKEKFARKVMMRYAN